jgi:hypothetical protein
MGKEYGRKCAEGGEGAKWRMVRTNVTELFWSEGKGARKEEWHGGRTAQRWKRNTGERRKGNPNIFDG